MKLKTTIAALLGFSAILDVSNFANAQSYYGPNLAEQEQRYEAQAEREQQLALQRRQAWAEEQQAREMARMRQMQEQQMAQPGLSGFPNNGGLNGQLNSSLQRAQQQFGSRRCYTAGIC